MTLTPKERAARVVEQMGKSIGPDIVFMPDTWRRAIEAEIIDALTAYEPLPEDTILATRDDFIVRKGLWAEFVGQLPKLSPPTK